LGLGGAVLDVVPGAGEFESVSTKQLTIGNCLLEEGNGRPSGTGGGELNAVIVGTVWIL
jgi:hypothetical protein